MIRLNRIKIQGFRRLASVDLEMRPLMVMIGANGVGKSSVLDAMSLLSASARSRLALTLSELGGISSVLTRGRATELVLSVMEEVAGQAPLVYEIHVAPQGNGYSIVKEHLSQEQELPGFKLVYVDVDHDVAKYFDGNFMTYPSWGYSPGETALSQAPRNFTKPEETRRFLSDSVSYHVLDVSRRAPIKLPQSMRPASLPGVDGEDIVPYLYSLRETDRDRFDSVIDSLRAGFPTFEDLAFPPVAAGTIAMTWKDRNFKHPIYMNELSEGTLRFLWLVSLLQSPSLPAITMIDEPEVSLHPELLSLLADLMREASKRTQLIVATHSDRFIRFLEPKEVVVLDSDGEGLTTAAWADSLDLERWLEDYSLDDIWRMGRIGGRS